ncbi:hypothetical protein TRFO_07886 [Tritrichomonas foetus]|uniref:Serine/threonine-protein phosphatase n=1 Tax=Tritrichomonas foetus TaxID=1144522 RepID=A0A1J4JP93_9EUKA|nr:hypothetical protein TRFO_07886 [Tritrichomonas foetus]|eukprot:OHT00562.1 hypothetical protein TRFO_07886 [Tritrichomonas foetus]
MSCGDTSFFVFQMFTELFQGGDEDIAKIGTEVPLPSFTKDCVFSVFKQILALVKKNPQPVVDVKSPCKIIGDLHGNFHDLLRIFAQSGEYYNETFIFLGDYVDRGCYSLETLMLLFAFKLQFPNNVILLRGNHEFESINRIYGFYSEMITHYGRKGEGEEEEPSNKDIISGQISPQKTDSNKGSSNKENLDQKVNICDHSNASSKRTDGSVLVQSLPKNNAANPPNKDSKEKKNNSENQVDESLFHLANEIFSFLPFAAVIDGKRLCLHGGIGPNVKSLDEIRRIPLPIVNYNNKMINEIVWSDPSQSCQNFGESERGQGQYFGPLAAYQFLQSSNLLTLIRAHQCVAQGVEDPFGNRLVITVFSSSNYGLQGNFGGFLRYENDEFRVSQFLPMTFRKREEAVKSTVRMSPSIIKKPLFLSKCTSIYNPITLRASNSENVHRKKRTVSFSKPSFISGNGSKLLIISGNSSSTSLSVKSPLSGERRGGQPIKLLDENGSFIV